MSESSALYAAFKAKDARFDGRFFVGISSTKIYCRPVCHAKMPKQENCTFYASAAEAEAAGHRPCLLCRPELAPGAAADTLAARAAQLLESHCGSGLRLSQLAARLRCSDRHLRRAFVCTYHVTPVAYLQTCRLLLAKSLLTDTRLSVLDVAMASGFGSLRRFNALFQTHYRMSPSALRKSAAVAIPPPGEIRIALGYRPPYPFEQMLRFLSARAIAGIERVEGGEYLRTVRLMSPKGAWVSGFIKVSHRPETHALSVALSEALLPVLPQVLAKVSHLFDLRCDPAAIYDHLAPMNRISPGLCTLGTRLPGCFDPYEMAVRAVLGQQITVKAATTLAGRLTHAFGVPLSTAIDGLTHAFPTPAEILTLPEPIEAHLGPLGILRARANTIRALAEAFQRGEIDADTCTDPEDQMRKLRALPGIGEWTAQYIAMRAMAWPDAFLATDAGVKKALAPHPPSALRLMAEPWRPWRSYATVNLWNSL